MRCPPFINIFTARNNQVVSCYFEAKRNRENTCICLLSLKSLTFDKCMLPFAWKTRYMKVWREIYEKQEPKKERTNQKTESSKLYAKRNSWQRVKTKGDPQALKYQIYYEHVRCVTPRDTLPWTCLPYGSVTSIFIGTAFELPYN